MPPAPVSTDVAAWRRRESKRGAAVQAIKASPEYAACGDRPPTPDPLSRALTKRQWERRMRDWRHALRAQAALRPVDWLGGPEEPQVALAPFLYDCWEDPRAWAYHCDVPPGLEDDVHIHATLVSGRPCFTEETGHFAMALPCENGSFCYELALRNSSALPWLGVTEADAFLWRRLTPEEL